MLIDFIAERLEVQAQELGNELWILEIGGSSRTKGGGAGMVLRSPDGLTIVQAIKLSFLVSNNEAE